jgi:3-oxoacyl-[acyl-carrier protein] reductase
VASGLLSRIDKIPAFELRDAFGAIYGLVNNAGIGTEGAGHHAQFGLVADRSDQIRGAPNDSRRRRPHRQHLLDHCLDRVQRSVVYATSKAAAGEFIRSLAREVGKLGITVMRSLPDSSTPN